MDGSSTTQREAAKLADAWAEYLARNEPYDHFATFTFKYPTISEGAAWRHFHRYLAQLESKAGGAVAFAGLLAESEGGAKHMHALVTGTKHLPQQVLRETWVHGISQTYNYDPRLGARGYLARHLIGDSQRVLGDIEQSGANRFIRAARRKPPRWRGQRARGRKLWCAIRRKALSAFLPARRVRVSRKSPKA